MKRSWIWLVGVMALGVTGCSKRDACHGAVDTRAIGGALADVGVPAGQTRCRSEAKGAADDTAWEFDEPSKKPAEIDRAWREQFAAKQWVNKTSLRMNASNVAALAKNDNDCASDIRHVYAKPGIAQSLVHTVSYCNGGVSVYAVDCEATGAKRSSMCD